MRRKNPVLYYGGKLLSFLLSVFFLSLAVFYASRLAPGDPLVSYYGERAEKMTVQERAQAEERLGLHQPIHVQYARWLQNALAGDFGISYKYKTDALSVIAARLPNSLLLGGTGFVLIFTGALALGAVCAWNEGNRLDRCLCRAGTAISCIPEFWLSLALILVFAVRLRWLPSGGAYSLGGGGPADRLENGADAVPDGPGEGHRGHLHPHRAGRGGRRTQQSRGEQKPRRPLQPSFLHQ